MKKLAATAFSYLFIFALTICGHSQVNNQAKLDEIAGKLLKNYQADTRELIYVHNDKPYYVAGNTIWFRVYLLNQQNHLPSNLSSKVYIELVNENDSVVQWLLLNGSRHELNGGMQIPLNLTEGYYQLRAYTDNIVETAPENIFRTSVYIVKWIANSTTSQKIPLYGGAANLQKGTDIRFYPEGGNLINGISSAVAVTAFDAKGNPLKISGMIRDERNAPVTSFHTSADGMGKFEIFPSKNRTYTANVKLPDNSEVNIPLPLRDENAWQLSLLQQDQNSMRFRIGQGDSLYEKRPVSYLLGVSRGRVCFAAVGTGMYEINVPTKDFSTGIASFYLFNNQKENVSKRHVFVERKNVNLEVNTGKTIFAAREQVKLDIAATDLNAMPLRAVFSVAVTDDKYVKWPSVHTSLSPYIFNNQVAAINFADTIQSENIAAERRDLRLIIADKLFKEVAIKTDSLVADSGIVIHGKILNTKKEPAAGFTAAIFADQHDAILVDTADARGRYDYPPIIFYENTPFMMQVTDQGGKNQDVIVTTDPPDMPTLPDPLNTSFANVEREYLAALGKYSRSGADTFLTGRVRQKLDRIVYESSSGQKQVVNKERKSGGRVITGEQLDRLGLNQTANAVKMLPGVMMMSGRLTILGGLQSMSMSLSDIEPLVVVDGVPASTSSVVDYLNSFPPNSIDYIEVLAGPEASQYGTRSGNGVILIKTANNLRPPKTGKQKGMSFIYPKGYHDAPEFYFPPYNIYEIRWAEFTDDRSTLYWNGEVMTDSTGKATLRFYTADMPSTYTIIITGITSKGDLIHYSTKLERK
jgi:hypothetical protein